MTGIRYLLVPVADDETLFNQAIEHIEASSLFGPLAEVTVDVFDAGLLRHIKAVHLVEESRNGRKDDK